MTSLKAPQNYCLKKRQKVIFCDGFDVEGRPGCDLTIDMIIVGFMYIVKLNFRDFEVDAE